MNPMINNMTTKQGDLTPGIHFTGPDFDLTKIEYCTCLNLGITKKEIETQNVDLMLNRLYPLKRPLVARKLFERISLNIDGFDDDNRELWEIPEVRRYIAQLDEKFPYWFYFSKKTRVFEVLVFFALCLCNFKKKGKRYYLTMDDVFESFFTRHLEAMVEMCRKTGFTEKQINDLRDWLIQFYTSGHELS
jgi:hypothetical protein